MDHKKYFLISQMKVKTEKTLFVGGISSTGPPSGLRTDAQLFSIIIAIINKTLFI